MDTKYNLIVKLSVFFLLISICIPKSHALVVAPIIAVSILKVLVWLLGAISIPIAYIVKAITKASSGKVIFISALVLLALGLIVFGIHYYRNNRVAPSLPSIMYSSLLPLTAIYIFILIPILLLVVLINHFKKLWSTSQVILLSLAIAFALEAVFVTGLYVLYL